MEIKIFILIVMVFCHTVADYNLQGWLASAKQKSYWEENASPTLDDFELHTFEQTWGSTALGFGGVGGQAMTTAITYVFIPIGVNQKCFVYFAGRFAYAVDYSEKFMKDVLGCNVASVYESGKYKV